MTLTPSPSIDLPAELQRQRVMAVVRGHDADGCFGEGLNVLEASLSGRDPLSVIARLRNAAPDAVMGAGRY